MYILHHNITNLFHVSIPEYELEEEGRDMEEEQEAVGKYTGGK